ncbi:kinase-like protein, partial [Coniophora puteana RWD-64-598 SS2]
RELVIWAYMEHPNVLPFYGVYLLNGIDVNACLISPLMDNGSLAQYLANSRDVSRGPLLYDISKGLKYLHAQSIIHGDIKPENILMDVDGKACIGDYGLASVNGASQDWTSRSQRLHAGTVRYQAPELLLDDAQVSRATDMYGFGCIIYTVSRVIPLPCLTITSHHEWF